MKPVKQGDRQVVNTASACFLPFPADDEAGISNDGMSYLQLDNSRPPGEGFHLFRMEAGTTTAAHRHNCEEQWLMLEGELVDNDGTRYVPGDFVLMKQGTEHNSTTPDGCLLAVYIEKVETNL